MTYKTSKKAWIILFLSKTSITFQKASIISHITRKIIKVGPNRIRAITSVHLKAKRTRTYMTYEGQANKAILDV